MTGAPPRIVTAFAVVIAGGCGGGSSDVCGNAVVEGSEQCDDGNTIQGDGCDNGCVRSTNDVRMIWSLVAEDEFPGFTGETCSGIGASVIRFEFSGAAQRTEEVQCDFFETFLSDFDAGDYTVVATLHDSAGGAVTSGMTSTSFNVNGDEEVRLNFPFADFTGDYTGNLFFRTAWGGSMTCAGASPPVTQHILRLEREGTAIPGMTDTGDLIDGSAPAACRDGESSQKVLGIPWGPATMTVTGLDSTGTPRFLETFETFIGAGVSNPEYLYDVNSLAPDAGLPDAPAPDAPVPDAAPSADALPPDAA